MSEHENQEHLRIEGVGGRQLRAGELIRDISDFKKIALAAVRRLNYRQQGESTVTVQARDGGSLD